VFIRSQPVLPRRAPTYPLFLAVLFVTSLVMAYIWISPINHYDWITTEQFIRYMTRLKNPYAENLPMDKDLLPYGIHYQYLPYSPWTLFYFGIIGYATTRLIVALTIAAWIAMIVDIGKPITLILILHPIFLMLWASSNIDLLVNGVGLWLILRGVRGWRLGVTIMLIAIKPQVLPLLLLLEGARLVWERDWEAMLTIAGIFGLSVALFPKWLDWLGTLPSSINILHGNTIPKNTPCSYSFSVFGAWGMGPALVVSAVILLIMRRRLREWRILAVILGLVWTPYVNPYSFAVLLILFYKTPAWRTLLFWGISIASLFILFTEYHTHERYGVLLFLLLTTILTAPDPEQTEENIARQHHQPVLPPVRWLFQRQRAA
jgi:hypothetical protein